MLEELCTGVQQELLYADDLVIVSDELVSCNASLMHEKVVWETKGCDLIRLN